MASTYFRSNIMERRLDGNLFPSVNNLLAVFYEFKWFKNIFQAIFDVRFILRQGRIFGKRSSGT